MNKVNLKEKLALFSEHWSPRIVGELNGQQVKLAKFKGEFVWHHHEHEDTFAPTSPQAVFSVDIDVSPPRIRLKETTVRWEEAGYLYTLSSETFQCIDDHQWVSYEPVYPLRVDIIRPEGYRHWIEFVG